MQRIWLSGVPIVVEQDIEGRAVDTRISWERFAEALLAAVDTGDDLDVRVERGAKAMFAVTNRGDAWANPTIPGHLKNHYRRLARAVLEAR
jgi:hypothetical protein